MIATAEKKLKVYDGQEAFILVEASKLSVDDDFITEVDAFGKVKKFRDVLINTIANTRYINDFYVQAIDPSEKEDGSGIEYVVGKMPAINHSYNWAREAAYNYAPQLDSRLATEVEHTLFCGVLIKKLIENGCSVNEAWHKVADDSNLIGNYKNSKMGKTKLLPTGSIRVLEFADLANTCKYVSGKGKFFIASGAYCHKSDCAFVADITRLYCNDINNIAVPLVVIPT